VAPLGGKINTGRTDQHGGSARGKIDTGRTRPASGYYDLPAKRILSQVEAGSLTITDLIKVAKTYALLAVAEAQPFSLGQDWPAGLLLTRCHPRSIGRPTVSTSRSDSSLRTPNLAPPVASNTELKTQRAAAANTTSRMSTPESPRSRSGISSASLMSAGEAATLRAN
jgi:hypothetical protein